MNKRLLHRNANKSQLELDNDHTGKSIIPWNTDSSDEGSFFNGKSEILWSREKNENTSARHFFQGLQSDFSDLTERSTSSCSWNNDDFDMSSSYKVNASLEAIEDALYDKKSSPLISKSVYQECCDWSSKFPFFRLKGERVILPTEDALLYSKQIENSCQETQNLSLQVEGKRMAIHAFEKGVKKCSELNDKMLESIDGAPDDEEYEECIALDTSPTIYSNEDESFALTHDVTDLASIKLLQDKVIEKLALEMWPGVISILQRIDQKKTLEFNEEFQLPPIIPVIETMQVPLRRPNTEGLDAPVRDFPQLHSILTISPKILQTRCNKSAIRSRPSSEIQLSRRHSGVSGFRRKHEISDTELNCAKQVSTVKETINENKQPENQSLFLPALEEDTLESGDLLRGLSMNSGVKNITLSMGEIGNRIPKKSEPFLPPINKKSNLSSNVTLTNDLLTFLGSPLKYKGKTEGLTSSRPNTSASRKAVTLYGNLNHKISERFSSLNNPCVNEQKKLDGFIPEKQVTLFPIVTSLVPNQERSSSHYTKKDSSFTTGSKKR